MSQDSASSTYANLIRAGQLILKMLVAVSLSLAISREAAAGPDEIIEPRPGHPVTIPTRYSGDRFLATPTLKQGGNLTFLADSAGGTFLLGDVVDRLKLPTEEIVEGGRKMRVTSLPSFKPDAAIPPPLGAGSRLLVINNNPLQVPAFFKQYNGLLGQHWFAGRVWTFDYPERRLLWRSPGDLPPHDAAVEVKLGFRKSPSGERETNFARLPVRIDGETIDFVLDTGATNILPEKVLKQVGDGGPAERGTSFLARSLYEKWHKKHPEWRALENARTLTGTAMIVVPEVVIGRCTVGPVWFTVQPDSAFHSYMASMMDKPTEGALGGSAFRQLVITVDWPNAIAVFERPSGAPQK
jgi:hypothetical protein